MSVIITATFARKSAIITVHSKIAFRRIFSCISLMLILADLANCFMEASYSNKFSAVSEATSCIAVSLKELVGSF
jgi:hypothetical protein